MGIGRSVPPKNFPRLSVRPQRAAMGVGIHLVSAVPRPVENFLEEMLDKQK